MDNKSVSISPDWVRCQSKSRPDRYYMLNKKTGETNWCPDTKHTPLKTVSAIDLSKTPAQDRLKRLQSSLQKKRHSVLSLDRGKVGGKCKQVHHQARAFFSDGEKESSTVKERVSLEPPREQKMLNATTSEKGHTLSTSPENKPSTSDPPKKGTPLEATTSEKGHTSQTSSENKPTTSVQSRLKVTRKKELLRPAGEETSSKPKAKCRAEEHKFVIPKKPPCRPVSSLEKGIRANLRRERTQSEILSKSKTNPSSSEITSTNGSRIVQSNKTCPPSKSRPPEENSSLEIPLNPTTTENSTASADRLSESLQYDVNDNEKLLIEEPKPGFVSKIKGLYNRLIGKETKLKKRNQPENKGREKQANVSLTSKPAFKPRKTDSKSFLRGVLQENDNGSVQKQLPSLPAKFSPTSLKVSSPIPVPGESANTRLQRLRQSLQLQQTTTSFTPSVSDVSNVSSSTVSPSVSMSDCEPMDWQPIFEESIDNISPSSLSSIRPADSSTFIENYDMINENLLRLAADKRQNKQWKTDHFYFVVDTNVFIEYLTFVKDLTTMKLCDTAGTLIYVPYCVLQELDKLKVRSASESIKTRTARAIKFLNKSLEEKPQRIQAQSAADETIHLIRVTSPDDSILNCCLQVMKHVDNFALLTEDINLQNKAMSNNIVVSTKSDLISKHESLI